jgi:lipoyl(octanoyl) transferase
MIVQLEKWGEVPYEDATQRQLSIFEHNVESKLFNHRLEPNQTKQDIDNHLIMCYHPPVYTIGKSGKPQHLLINEKERLANKISFYHTNRGGDITFHGPGQIVVYPIFDLEQFKPDVHWYMRSLEEVVIRTLADYGITAERFPSYTGVWIEPGIPFKERKICAMGVKLSRWVTMHGIALNVNTDLSYFNNIIPCGIEDKSVTSIQKELGKDINIIEVETKLVKYFEEVFACQVIN